MKKLSKEFWVGCLVLLVVTLMLAFGSLMGVFNPFGHSARFAVLYGFAGGVDTGSAVRVAGVKVGKVESIEFLEGQEVPLRVTISVAKRALPAVRQDSRFYINMAGIIGERYIEIAHGAGEPLAPGATVRGVDPPRIDQLLSQGYSVFGRIQDFLEENEAALTAAIDQLTVFLKGKENRKVIFSLLANLNAVSGDLREALQTEEGRQFFRRLSEVLKRAEQIDKPTLKKFLQEEGIRARIF